VLDDPISNTICTGTDRLVVSLQDEAPQHPICPITGEELQVKFLSDSGENSLKY
jgi:hypothetical protein